MYRGSRGAGRLVIIFATFRSGAHSEQSKPKHDKASSNQVHKTEPEGQTAGRRRAKGQCGTHPFAPIFFGQKLQLRSF
nr:unnamed protein product [Digitaria exilis]